MEVNINENDILYEEIEIIHKPKENTQEKLSYKFLKRSLDIVGGIVGIILLIPITILVYVFRHIRKENEGPIFYEQLRIGKNGKEFKIHKYRTMVMNADEKLFEYLNKNPRAKEEYKRYKKLKKDPRITSVGSFLRKTSLDEFPQFINVLKGEMSLVGPRPYLYREKKDMGEAYKKIITCKPGITGYWQVNGRSDVDFKQRLEMDKYYIENRSMILDTKILLKTVFKTLIKKGAM